MDDLFYGLVLLLKESAWSKLRANRNKNTKGAHETMVLHLTLTLLFCLFFFPDNLLLSSRATIGRMSKSHSASLLDDPDDEEYEYMNKQMTATPVSPKRKSKGKKPNKKRTSSVSSQATAGSGDTLLSMEARRGHSWTNQSSDSEQQGMDGVEYEYMDIRGNDKDESPPAHDPPPPPLSSTQTFQEEEEGNKDEEEYVEDSNYHYMNRQPKLRQALQGRGEVKMQESDEGELYEYEDMDCFAALQPEGVAVYQNMQRESEKAGRGKESYRSSFEPYLKVRAGVGVGEPANGDQSFDNPDYWHSRMFLKPNAVPT